MWVTHAVRLRRELSFKRGRLFRATAGLRAARAIIGKKRSETAPPEFSRNGDARGVQSGRRNFTAGARGQSKSFFCPSRSLHHLPPPPLREFFNLQQLLDLLPFPSPARLYLHGTVPGKELTEFNYVVPPLSRHARRGGVGFWEREQNLRNEKSHFKGNECARGVGFVSAYRGADHCYFPGNSHGLLTREYREHPDSPIGTQLFGFLEWLKTRTTVYFIWALSPFKGVKTNLKVKLAHPLFRV